MQENRKAKRKPDSRKSKLEGNHLLAIYERAPIGNGRRAPRLERPFVILLFVGGKLLLEPREFVTWAAICGGITAFMVPFLSFHYQLMCLLGEGDYASWEESKRVIADG